MEAVLGNLSRAAAGKPNAPRLLRGTGSDETHLLIVATAERGLCGAFNSSIVRRARADINQLTREGKTVKILTVGKKGREQLRRDHRDKFVHHVDLSQAKRLGFQHAREIADEVLRRFDEGEFDVATLYFSRFQTVLTQVPTALQLIPAVFEESEDARSDQLRIRAGRGGDPRRPAAAQHRDADLPRRCSRTAPRNRARA